MMGQHISGTTGVSAVLGLQSCAGGWFPVSAWLFYFMNVPHTPVIAYIMMKMY